MLAVVSGFPAFSKQYPIISICVISKCLIKESDIVGVEGFQDLNGLNQ